MKFSIVVPCYNEAKNIPLILNEFDTIIKRNDIEVILVDNGSTDNTNEVIELYLSKYKFARSIKIDINQGYGFGIVSGLNVAKGELIGYTHADMQTNPTDLLTALEIVENLKNCENCYVKGNRKGRPLFDQIFTIGMSLFESLYLKKILWDINAQPNVFHRNFFEKIKDSCPKDFSLDLYLLYMAKKMRFKVIRFKVVFPPRVFGKSSWNTGIISKWKFIKRTLDFSYKLKKEI